MIFYKLRESVYSTIHHSLEFWRVLSKSFIFNPRETVIDTFVGAHTGFKINFILLSSSDYLTRQGPLKASPKTSK